MKKIGIIGGAGFIGSYVTLRFLEKGFQVKVSTTDILIKGKFQHLMDLPHSEHLYISEMDVRDLDQLREFVLDCDIIVHCGTPFQLDVKNPKIELFDPTLKGTENFLKAIIQSPSIQKVVFVASVEAYNTNFPKPSGKNKSSDTISENDIPYFSEESHPYAKAKFLANKIVNDFIEHHHELNFEITSVSPVMVMGKSLSNRQDSTSTELQYLIKNWLAPNPDIQMFYDTDIDFAIINVKDVAEGIYKAAMTSGLHSKNYLLSTASYSVSDVSLMLNGQQPKNSEKHIYQNHLAVQDLGLKFQSVQTTLNEYSN